MKKACACQLAVTIIHLNNVNISFKIWKNMEVQEHHIKLEPCSTRPKYREGNVPKVVKVIKIYSID